MYFLVLSFHSRHTVKEAPWSYPPDPKGPALKTLDLAVPPPPYVSFEVSTFFPTFSDCNILNNILMSFQPCLL